MSSDETSSLIDRVAAILLPHHGGNEAAVDAIACEIVGEITSRYLVIQLPPEAHEAVIRQLLADADLGLTGKGGQS